MIPYSLETEALRRMPAHVFGVLMSLEPAVAALAGLVVLGQHLGARDLVAIGLVIAAASARRSPPGRPSPSTCSNQRRPAGILRACSRSTSPNVLTVAAHPAGAGARRRAARRDDHGDLLAAIVFALASLTDAIDGYIARSRGAITTFGKLMDPVADKLLIIAALVALVSLDRLAAWIAMVIIAREFAVTVTRLGATRQGVVIAANWWGKAKTIVQVAAIFFAIAFDPTPALGRRAALRRGGDHRRSRASTTSSGCAGCCARPRSAGRPTASTA